mmetsp:Transcript_62988/g.73316  ORF Transcript_62988/g.73316 Transcript_62988/m.73316 type:complete len:317 (+) Transcript_62988:37-987(+)
MQAQVASKRNLYDELIKLGEDSEPISAQNNPKFRTVIKDEIWVASDVITKEEAQLLIKLSEDEGYTEALITTGIGKGVIAKDIRDSKRVMIDDPLTAAYLFKRFQNLVPRAFEGGMLLSINERLRFLKYDEAGNNFARHYDGRFPRNKYEASLVTIQLYLNEDMTGGETTFFNKCFPGGKLSLNPKTGQVLLFRQAGWLHEGSPLKSGVKYTIRTEFMYKWFKNSDVEEAQKELKKCGICDKIPQFIKTNCDHAFLICDCIPFNDDPDHILSPNCQVCNKKFNYPKDVGEHLKKKTSEGLVFAGSGEGKKSDCNIF